MGKGKTLNGERSFKNQKEKKSKAKIQKSPPK